ncbi:hypothetical protein Ga0074812_1407 [Parafrankia irregularis]|uniref:VOC domain-containing protein n=1 Tax=Parafrankia irregularis TaxID=795642 RepID=A0A0S4QZ39_9ACTN|nr:MULTISPECIES: VOC family protein [Parafrankia]MBE3203537.1 VOC family protein [Parafrankia sp. CH37]CUU60431.1 hypothetical protein Ga0074812_1407 [Parafrankia irregularis]
MRTPTFRFTKLVVSDLAVAESFYSGVFGMKVINRVMTDEHKYPLEEITLSSTGEPDTHVLVIARYLEHARPPAGSAWTGFVVPNIDVALAAVESAGGRIEVPVHGNAEFGTRAAIATDPDGHPIEIIQLMYASTPERRTFGR